MGDRGLIYGHNRPQDFGNAVGWTDGALNPIERMKSMYTSQDFIQSDKRHGVSAKA